MAPKLQRCSAAGCGAKVNASNSVTVMDLPDLVKVHVLRERKCTEDCVLCHTCINPGRQGGRGVGRSD
jgi:hypothetical protein